MARARLPRYCVVVEGGESLKGGKRCYRGGKDPEGRRDKRYKWTKDALQGMGLEHVVVTKVTE